MKYLKKFNESATFPTDPDQIMRIIREIKISEWGAAISSDLIKIHSDGTVDIDGSVSFSVGRLPNDRLPIKFGRVTGIFNISSKALTTLEGCPDTVDGVFSANSNFFSDLKGAPQEVYSFNISNNNNLTSLEGIPKQIGDVIHFSGCRNLWDLTPLKDVFFTKRQCFHQACFVNTPASALSKAFRNDTEFRDSLVFNYIRKPIMVGHKKLFAVNLFRFQEALDDAGIDLKSFGVLNQNGLGPSYGHEWVYLDDDGSRVDFDGNPI